MIPTKKNFFDIYPKITLGVILSILILSTILLAEWAAGSLGLGKTVLYEANPIYGYRPRPNQIVARRVDQTIKINNLGLRAETDWDPKNYHNKILFLGDSVTYGGSYIANNQLFSHLAVAPFPEWEAGNAGVNGWGVNNVYALVKETGFLPAQIYVSVFPEGDFYRGYTRIGGQAFWTRPPRFALEELFQYCVYKLNLKKMPLREYYALNTAEKNQIASIAVRNLKALDDYLKAQGRTHLIYISPSRENLLGQPLLEVDPVVKGLLAESGINAVYLQERLTSYSNAEIQGLFHDNIHLSQEGHAAWGKMIAQDLNKFLSL